MHPSLVVPAKIRVGLGLDWVEGSSYSDYIRQITEVEALGYDQIWISNDKFYRDMYVLATVVAEHTQRVKIGTFIADPYSIHPALNAVAIATLDEVSHGRAILGIGAGGTGFTAMGIKRTKPAKAINEAITVIRELLQGKVVNFDGEVISCHNGLLNFPTRPDIPIVIASRGDLVLKIAGEMADGVMIATYAEPVGIGHALSRVVEGTRKVGRCLDELTVSLRIDACITSDRRMAYEAVKPILAIVLWTSYPDRAFVQRVGLSVPTELEKIIEKRDYNLMAPSAHLVPDEFVEKFSWAGSVDDVIRKVAAVVQAGIRNIVILPQPTSADGVQETTRAFIKDVIPAVESGLGK